MSYTLKESGCLYDSV